MPWGQVTDEAAGIGKILESGSKPPDMSETHWGETNV
jgi:hypothetical protein